MTAIIDASRYDGLAHDKECFYSGDPLPIDHEDLERCICDPFGRAAARMAKRRATHKRRILNVLRQDRVWYDKDGTEIALTAMSLRYKKNVLAFLERRAAHLKWRADLEGCLLAGQMSEAAQDAIGRELDEQRELKPTTWLYRTDFMIRLEQLIREGHDGPID